MTSSESEILVKFQCSTVSVYITPKSPVAHLLHTNDAFTLSVHAWGRGMRVGQLVSGEQHSPLRLFIRTCHRVAGHTNLVCMMTASEGDMLWGGGNP